MQRSHGVPLQIRIRLNCGEGVVRAIDSSLQMDYTVAGQTTHLAARMEQMAEPGSVHITAETQQLAEGSVQVRRLGPVPVKGLAHSVEVFELIGTLPSRIRLQAAVTRSLTRFEGRQAEIEALRQALERTGRGHGQLVAVLGEPGVGKTRLFYESSHSHRTPGWLILDSHSVFYGKATPYLNVRDFFKGYFEIEDRNEARKIREKVTGKLLTLDATLRATLPAFLTMLDVPVDNPSWPALALADELAMRPLVAIPLRSNQALAESRTAGTGPGRTVGCHSTIPLHGDDVLVYSRRGSLEPHKLMPESGQ